MYTLFAALIISQNHVSYESVMTTVHNYKQSLVDPLFSDEIFYLSHTTSYEKKRRVSSWPTMAHCISRVL